MNNIFYPFIGSAQIEFGFSRKKVQEILGSNFKEFKRNVYAENTLDYYIELNMFIEYDKSNLCNAIEFSAPNNLMYNNQNLFDLTYLNLIAQFKNKSKKFSQDEFGITFYDLGFGVFIIELDKIETINIFSKDYW